MARKTLTTEEVVKLTLVSPMTLMRDVLGDCPLSSNEVERESGVPASVVRSIRNQSVDDIKTGTWAALMRWLVESGRVPVEVEMPKFRRYRPKPKSSAA